MEEIALTERYSRYLNYIEYTHHENTTLWQMSITKNL